MHAPPYDGAAPGVVDPRPTQACRELNEWRLTAHRVHVNPPDWCGRMKCYIAGDVRAGLYAIRSLKRWRQRHWPEEGPKR
jgi:hypothetical protein